MKIEMTMQEVFDVVAAHLLAQGQRSTIRLGEDDTLSCAYQTPDGLKCAIGCLIPEYKYSKDFEGVNVRGLADEDQGGQVIPRVTDSDDEFSFLLSLQRIHDAVDPKDWQNYLEEFALDNDLTTEAIT